MRWQFSSGSRGITSTIQPPTTGDFLVDIDGGGADFQFGVANGSAAFVYSFGNGQVYGTGPVTQNTNIYVKNQSYSSSFGGLPATKTVMFDAFGGGTGGQNWSAGGYMGFTLGGNQGWLQLTYTPFTLQVGQFAFDNTGATLKAGHTGAPAIPEPGSLLTLALGAAGLLAWRAHREKQAKKAKKQEETNAENVS